MMHAVCFFAAFWAQLLQMSAMSCLVFLSAVVVGAIMSAPSASSKQLSLSASSKQLALPKPAASTLSNLDANVAKSLVATKGTKTSTCKILRILSEAGLLNNIEINDSNARAVKRKLTDAASGHAKHTHGMPYGPLLQSMELGIEGCEHLEFMHPCAFLYYLSSISPAFATMMKDISVPGRPLRICIYADGLEPGNPFRHDKARHLMSIYWCIADWPQYILQRSFAWPVFAIIRTKFFEKFPAGLSRLMRMVLRIFFKDDDHSFTKGVHINCPTGDYVVTGIFGGFLADLVGHKEITEWKGHQGRLCCISCSNVTNMLHAPPNRELGEVPANCCKLHKFKVRSNQDLFDLADELAMTYVPNAKGNKTAAFQNKEKSFGITHTPGSLLLDTELRDIYRPVDHCIRDWQHIVCQDGVVMRCTPDSQTIMK